MAMKLWVWLDSMGLIVSTYAFLENMGNWKSDLVFIASFIFLLLRLKSIWIDIKRKELTLQSEKLSFDEKKFDIDKKIHPEEDDENKSDEKE